jgi:hypothetical protein
MNRPGVNTALFDHLLGAGKQRIRDGEAEHLRRLEIDHWGALHLETAANLLKLLERVLTDFSNGS